MFLDGIYIFCCHGLHRSELQADIASTYVLPKAPSDHAHVFSLSEFRALKIGFI
jgi:hypothetical protein